MIFRLPQALKIAIQSAHYLAILLPVFWLLWAWHRGGVMTLALHLPLAAAGFLMLQNAFTLPCLPFIRSDMMPSRAIFLACRW